MASHMSNGDEKRNTIFFGHQINGLMHEGVEDKSTKPNLAGTGSLSALAEHDDDAFSKSGKLDENNNVTESSSKHSLKRKKVAPGPKSRRFPVRSSLGDRRVLRSMSKTNSYSEPELDPKMEPEPVNTTVEMEPEPVNTTVHPVMKKSKRGRKPKVALNDEFSVTRKRVRNLLTRMKYQQNFIDAYSGDGWKGQSAEKLKPEKELERAKSEIVRCKFEIRDLFQHLDSLSLVGRFDESLFDSEGRICSEDIFCAKCGSKDISPDNDIILCDGVCNRGFHQMCLNPPLLSENIPVGDAWWFCPACHCKQDCINLLNEFQGCNNSIKDEWTKVFPEFGAANGGNLYGNQKESYFTCSAESSDTSNNNGQNIGITSDESEDDDFKPDAPDTTKSIEKEELSSDESDFTSDSDEFCIELSKTSRANEDSSSYMPELKPFAQSDEGSGLADKNNSQRQENVQGPKKRQVARFDYEKLYNEAYVKSSSDSSDDEDWSQSNRRKKRVTRKKSNGQSKVNVPAMKNHNKSQNVAINTEVDTANNSSASAHRRLGEAATQKLNESFQKNHYPSREEKGRLADELGISFQQVDKWFTSTRHSFRASPMEPLFHTGASPNIESIRESNKTEIGAVRSSVSNENKWEIPVPAKHVKVGGAEVSKDGGSMGLLDRDRQKAVARELRRMKQGR